MTHKPCCSSQQGRRGLWRIVWLVVSLMAALALAQCRWPFPRDVSPAALDIPLPASPLTFDPMQSNDITSRQTALLLFGRLTRLSPDGREVVPELAAEWKVSGDGRIYTFYLRQGLAWVDRKGQAIAPLTAEDVVWTFRRLCNPTTGVAEAPFFYVVEGCREAHTAEGTPDLEGIEVRAVDETTVEFTLNEPAAFFPALLTMLAATPLPRQVVEAGANEVWTTPDTLMTSGPYTLQTRERDRLVLEKNPAFPVADGGNIARVVAHVVPDDVQAVEEYDRNALDLVRLPPAFTAPFAQDKARRSEVRLLSASCSVFAGFVTVKPPLNYQLVRLALSEAVDRASLTEVVLGGNGFPARHLTPPGIFGAPPLDQGGVVSDPEHARELLARAGYPGGQGFPPITLVSPQEPTLSAVARHLAQTWEESLGIEVRLQAFDPETYTQELDRTRPLEEAPHVWLYRYCTPSPDAYHWLYNTFHCEGSPNWARRVCDTFDTLLEQAAAERDAANRRELYAQAEETLAVDEAAYVPLYHEARAMLVKPWLQFPEQRTDGWNMSTWSLDMRAKQAAQRQK